MRTLVIAIIGLVGCTADTRGEERIEAPPTVVQRIDLFGDVIATETPIEPLGPRGKRELFLIDQSASLQQTDPRNARFAAIDAVVDDVLSDPDGAVAFVGFASWARTLGFTRDRSRMGAFTSPAGGLGTASDVQGALVAAAELVYADLAMLTSAERREARYEVTLIIDGSPGPVCNAGCGDGDTFVACDTTDFTGFADEELIDLPRAACPEYNTEALLLQRTADLHQLATLSHADLALHIRHIVPNDLDEDIAQTFDVGGGEAMLRAIAEVGEGDYEKVDELTAANLR